jgi:Na+-transporting NADH:ubiquinone oxidoreductase subunit NqrA
MSKDIKIKKGLTIRLKGEADKSLSNAPRSRTFAIRPSDFHLFTPKLVKKEGEKNTSRRDFVLRQTKPSNHFFITSKWNSYQDRKGTKTSDYKHNN